MLIAWADSDMSSQNAVLDAIRWFFSIIDIPVYALLGAVYQLFFNIASADIFSGGTITKFYQRVQVIIGVFMMFQLAMTILRGIVNPDTFVDPKGGAGNVIFRICTALIMLALIVPINIPSARNEYEKQINNNGLLFGTLYSLQNRILSNNTIGRLVMGTADNQDNYTATNTDASDEDDLDKASRIFTSTIVKGFYRINLIPEEDRKHEDGKEDDQINDNRVCQDIGDDVMDEYRRLDSDPTMIISFVNETCEPEFNLLNHLPIINAFAGNKKYVFTYQPFLSFIIGIVFTVIMIGFCVDVAVRTIKLAILRLLAPIPIISYMDPKGGKDGAFNAWVKALMSTYIDLFIRVATVYFVIFVIQEMIVNGIVMKKGGLLGVFTWIFIWIGLFFFAKQAPKFIKQVLNIKDDGSNWTNGFALGAAGVGMIGSAVTNYKTTMGEQKEMHPDQTIRNFGKSAASGIFGGLAGGYAGLKSMQGKDASVKGVLAAQSQRNAQRQAHSTFPGRILDSAYGAVTGDSLAAKGSRELEANKAAFSTLKNWKTAVRDEAAKNGGAFDYTLSNGQVLHGVTYDRIRAMKEAGADNDGMYTLTDAAGNQTKYDASLFGTNTMDDIADRQVSEWQSGNRRQTGVDAAGNPVYADSYQQATSGTGKLVADKQRTIKAVGDAQISVGGQTGEQLVDNYGSLGKAMGEANRGQQQRETDMKQRIRIASSQQASKK